MTFSNQSERTTETDEQKISNKDFFDRVYEDFKDMDVKITATVAEGVACFARMHDNPEEKSSDIVAQWIDQHMAVDISPELESKEEFIQYSNY